MTRSLQNTVQFPSQDSGCTRLSLLLFPIVWWCCIFSSGVGWKQRRVVSNLRRHDDISDRQSFEDKWTRKAWANHNPHEGKEYLRRRIPWLQCKKRCLHENPYQVDEAMAMKVKYATAPMIWKTMQPKAIFYVMQTLNFWGWWFYSKN